MRLRDRIALITGSASGIGSACALRFAEEGAVIAGMDVVSEGDERWAEAVKLSPRSSFDLVDVRDEASIAAAMAAVRQRFGRIDVVVNSAGVAGGGPVHLLATEEWDRVVGINLRGTFLVCKHALAPMLEQRRGSIINIASIEGLQGSEGGSAYNASKAGVVMLTRNMAMDYARVGIRVNAVCPGFIDTPMYHQVLDLPGFETFRDGIVDQHQLGRTGTPLEIANAALFLASDEASFITGHALVVDGGYTAGHRVGFTKLMGLE